MDIQTDRYTAFAGHQHLATGTLADVAMKAKKLHNDDRTLVFIFDNETGRTVDLDLWGASDDIVLNIIRHLEEKNASTSVGQQETEPVKKQGPGRPRLGVVAREVTLLPRHWEWLNEQPGGASVTLRKLVEQARRNNQAKDRARRAQEAAYRFMSTMAGDFIHFEEASRALFANDFGRFAQLIQAWPEDVRDHLLGLVNIAERFKDQAEQEGTHDPQ